MLADNIVNVINLETKSIVVCPLSPDRSFTFCPDLYKLYETETPDESDEKQLHQAPVAFIFCHL